MALGGHGVSGVVALSCCALLSCAADPPTTSPADAARAVDADATRADPLPSLAEDPAEERACPTAPPPAGTARAMRVVCDAQRPAGPLAMARLGDVVIESARARFVIRSGEESATTIGAPGGGVIDATAEARAPDGLKELLPTLNYHGLAVGPLRVVRASGAEAVVRATFSPRALELIASVLPLVGQRPELRGVLEYSLSADDATLRVRACAVPEDPTRDVSARAGMALLLGGASELFAPGHGVLSEESGAATGAAALAESPDGAYGVALDGAATMVHVGTITLLQRTERVTFTPELARCVTMRLAAGRTAADAFDALGLGAGTAVEVPVPRGGRAELVDAEGRPLLRARETDGRVRVRAVSDPSRARVARAGGAFGPAGAVPATGTLVLRASVRGAAGAPVRVTIARPDGAFVRREVVVGEGRVALPVGSYRVSASRGMEHSAVSTEVRVESDAEARFDAVLDAVLDTSGYASTDFHLHTELSTDSAHPVTDAVRQMAAEGLELVASTDHDFITDFSAVAAPTDVRDWIVAVPGEEVSTVRLGHYGGYPLRRDEGRAGAGAVPWFGLSPAQIASALRARGDEVIVQVNHPRLRGSGVFDQIGLDAATGRALGDPTTVGLPAGTDLTELAFDVVEVWNGYTRGGNERTFTDWLALRAAGRRFIMVGNSDSHRPDRAPGAPRSFVRVPDDARGRVRWEHVRAGLRAGDVSVGAGLFVEVVSEDGARPGGRAVAREGSVSLRVRVQGPPWADCTRVRVYRGTEVVLDRRVTTPADRAVRFDETVRVPVTAPSFVVVRADGERDAEPVFGFPPFGVTNALDVAP